MSCLQGFTRVLDKMEALTNDIPLVKSHVARFSADAVINNIVSLNELAAPMEGGTHYPLFLLCLQQVGSVCVMCNRLSNYLRVDREVKFSTSL